MKKVENLIAEMQDKKMTTQEWVTDILRKSILYGYFHHNKPLETTTLAKMLGVSRMPVRTALIQLENEGLVTLEPHKKAFPTKLTAEEVKKIYDIRAELEALTVRLVCETIDKSDFLDLEDLVHNMDVCKNEGEFIRLNKNFHDALSLLSGNEVLHNINVQLRNNVDRYVRLFTIDMEVRKAGNREHKELLIALKNQDVKKSEKIIRKHLRHTCEGVIEIFKSLS